MSSRYEKKLKLKQQSRFTPDEVFQWLESPGLRRFFISDDDKDLKAFEDFKLIVEELKENLIKSEFKKDITILLSARNKFLLGLDAEKWQLWWGQAQGKIEDCPFTLNEFRRSNKWNTN